MKYPIEVLDANEDDGTMPSNVETLAEAVVGHRIVRSEVGPVENNWYGRKQNGLILTLDNGKQVTVADTDDCCAITELEAFLTIPNMVDHVITGVGTTDGYTTWHIYADLGDVMNLKVNWSCGNPFYYGYGFEIKVVDNLKDVTATTLELK